MVETREGLFQVSVHSHLVQFYKADEPLLNRNVASFLWDGLLRGDGLLVVATQVRRESLSLHLERLGAEVAVALREGQLAMLDAHALLHRFMVDGQPDRACFHRTMEEAIGTMRPRAAGAGICIYGEMVGVLWEEGRNGAAIRLEEYWNEVLQRGRMKLFCAYPVDIFTNEFDGEQVHEVLQAHTHVLPTGPNGDLGEALAQALDDVFGAGADTLRQSMRSAVRTPGTVVPEAEDAILWLRRHLPSHADTVLARARGYYEASQGPGFGVPVSMRVGQ